MNILGQRAYELVSLAAITALAVIGFDWATPPRELPSIVTPPVGRTASVGDTVSFSVAASGPNLRYQWLRNNRAILDGTRAEYVVRQVGGADTGARFSVIVSNEDGRVTSTPAELRVVPRDGPASGGPRAMSVGPVVDDAPVGSALDRTYKLIPE